MLLEGDKGLCPSCKHLAAFTQEIEIRDVAPIYDPGGRPGSGRINSSGRTNFLLYSCQAVPAALLAVGSTPTSGDT